MKNKLLGSLLISLSLSLTFTAIAYTDNTPPSFSKVVAFGDSLSDDGNDLRMSQQLHKMNPQIPAEPVAPYYNGNFTNGDVWVQDLTATLNNQSSATNTTPVQLIDNAYGGAWAEPTYLQPASEQLPWYLRGHLILSDQVDNYIGQFRNNDNAHTLYIVWIGGNDYLQDRPCSDDACRQAVAFQTVQSISEQLSRMLKAGAQYILVPNLPDLGTIPWAHSQYAQGASFATDLSQLADSHNLYLAAAIKKLQEAYPAAHIIIFDIQHFFDTLLKTKQWDNYQFDVVDQPCYPVRPGHPDPAVQPCADPDKYLFWDYVHPTAQLHRVITVAAIEQLEQQTGFRLN